MLSPAPRTHLFGSCVAVVDGLQALAECPPDSTAAAELRAMLSDPSLYQTALAAEAAASAARRPEAFAHAVELMYAFGLPGIAVRTKRTAAAVVDPWAIAVDVVFPSTSSCSPPLSAALGGQGQHPCSTYQALILLDEVEDDGAEDGTTGGHGFNGGADEDQKANPKKAKRGSAGSLPSRHTAAEGAEEPGHRPAQGSHDRSNISEGRAETSAAGGLSTGTGDGDGRKSVQGDDVVVVVDPTCPRLCEAFLRSKLHAL